MLREGGPLLGHLGELTLDAITPPVLREWWAKAITTHGLSTKTGRAYVDVLSSVLGYARDLGLVTEDPIPAFREQLRRRSRTQKARAEAEAGRTVRPIETPRGLAKHVEAAEKEAARDFVQEFEVQRGAPTKRRRTQEERTHGLRGLVAVHAMLDAGLRMGEVCGLTWGQVRWGEDENDPRRALVIDRSRARGRDEGPLKSGRTRTVALSRRLRRALERLHQAQWQPGPDARLFPGFDPRNFGQRDWLRLVRVAELPHHAPKDLRDTFASWLLSLGVQLGYVSKQLGHADVAVTTRHYAKWVEGESYREPMTLLPGEVPADLLARVVEGTEAAEAPRESSHFSPHLHTSVSESEAAEAETTRRDEGVIDGVSDGVRTRDLQGHNLAL